jgi:hypothetical protein
MQQREPLDNLLSLRQHRWLWRGSVLAISLMLLALGSYAYRGFATRIRADDFCVAGATITDGMRAVQEWSYANWNSRFSSNFLLTGTDLLVEQFVQIAPLCTLIGWVAVAIWVGWLLGGLLDVDARRWFAVMCGVLLVFSTTTSASLYEALYWRPGYMTYTVPLVLSTLYTGWLLARIQVDRPIGLPDMTISALAMLFIGGLSETQAVLQLAALALLLGLCLLCGGRWLRRMLLPLTITGLAGSAAALWLIMTAPAVAARLAAEEGVGLVGNIPAVVARIGYVVMYDVLLLPVTPPVWWADICALALALVLPLGLALFLSPARQLPRRPLVWLCGIPLISVALVAVSVLPVSYGYSAAQAPPLRLLIVPRLLSVVGLMAWGYIFGLIVRRFVVFHPRAGSWVRVLVATLLIGLLFGSAGYATATTLASMPTAYRLAAGWDANDRLLQQQDSEEIITIPARPGMPDITNVYNKWSNGCVARYYQLAGVMTLPVRSTTVMETLPRADPLADQDVDAVIMQGTQPLLRVAHVDARAAPASLHVEVTLEALTDLAQNYDLMFQFAVEDGHLRLWDWPMYGGITLLDAPSLPIEEWQPGVPYRHTTILPVQPGRYYVLLWIVESDTAYIVPLRATPGEFGGIPLGWHVISDADNIGP